MPTAVDVGTKLKPETPIPLQFPPTGEPANGIKVSLIQILEARAAAVTTGKALTVSVATDEVVVCPQLFVTSTLYLLLFCVVTVPVIVNVGVYEPPIVRLVQVTPASVLTCHW